MDAGINHFVFISAVVFVLGVYTAVTHKKLIRVLLGIVLMLMAPIINFAALSGIKTFNPEGQIIIFTISGICLVLLITGSLLALNYFKNSDSAEIEGEFDA